MLTVEEQSEFDSIITTILSDSRAAEMKKYIQHGSVSTYDHCLRVARECFEYVKRHSLKIDVNSLVRAAFLHDFYLYDWHETGDGTHRLHGFRHAKRAAENARREFLISDFEMSLIRSHMWPLTLFCIPSSREGWILSYIDKKVSFSETFRKKKTKKDAAE